MTKEPKTDPIPTPAPARPIVANPAPINLDDCNNICKYSNSPDSKAQREYILSTFCSRKLQNKITTVHYSFNPYCYIYNVIVKRGPTIQLRLVMTVRIEQTEHYYLRLKSWTPNCRAHTGRN